MSNFNKRNFFIFDKANFDFDLRLKMQLRRTTKIGSNFSNKDSEKSILRPMVVTETARQCTSQKIKITILVVFTNVYSEHKN